MIKELIRRKRITWALRIIYWVQSKLLPDARPGLEDMQIVAIKTGIAFTGAMVQAAIEKRYQNLYELLNIVVQVNEVDAKCHAQNKCISPRV